MRQLRIAKRQAALAIALADIAGVYPLERVTERLTRFADACVKGALRFLLAEEAQKAGWLDAIPNELEGTTGLVVIAMGKHGAFELNYSSDIDLVVFYEEERFPFALRGDKRTRRRRSGEAAGASFSRRRRSTAMCSASICACVPTPARPRSPSPPKRPSSTTRAWARTGSARPGSRRANAPAIPRRARSSSRTWSPSSGASISTLPPSRTSTRSSARSTPMPGHSRIAVHGHNIKLGRGGIREIEFFAQTQQLILGGRDRSLRERDDHRRAEGAARARPYFETARRAIWRTPTVSCARSSTASR